mgnify:FL=1
MVELTASELAARLGVSRRHASGLLGAGAIDGRQLSSGAWLADSDSVARYEVAARLGKGRKLDVDTAWGLLWELSGLDAHWLAPRTRSRIRARLRTASAEEISRAVADRTRAHRYQSASTARAAKGLITTGRAAAGALDVGLMNDSRTAVGYARSGSAAEHARGRFMVASLTGHDIIYDNTLPINYEGERMPLAVIAADLAASTDTRERSGGLRALEELRDVWLTAR